MGEGLYRERERVQKERMTAAAFGAWQTLAAQSKDFPGWKEYAGKMGLIEVEKVSKEDLKREADEALKKAQSILNRGLNGRR